MKANSLLIGLLVTLCIVSACNQPGKFAAIKILPLHPYRASTTDYNLKEPKGRTYVIKYFFIHGASEATDALSARVDSFTNTLIRKDTADFNDYGGYIVRFYRQTGELNSAFRENINSVFYNALDAHEPDLLFEYNWENKEFMGCKFYENGKVKKTERKKLFD